LRRLRRSYSSCARALIFEAETYLTDFIAPRFFAFGDPKTHVLAQMQAGSKCN
jgi:hypothetical protein